MTLSPHVASLHCYPIKSCRGIELVEGLVERRGFSLDRRFMVVDDDGRFRTQRKDARLTSVAVTVDGDRLVASADGIGSVVVELGGADSGPVRDVNVWHHRGSYPDQGDEVAAFFSQVVGAPSRLVHMPDTATRRPNPKFGGRQGDRVGFADGYPFLLTTRASLAALQHEMDELVPMDRFRANIVVDGTEAWVEDEWRSLTIGAVEFQVAKACTRCVNTTTDQRTGERSAEALATLTRIRRTPAGVTFGIYLLPRSLGAVVSIGDEVGTTAVS
jgi:uncharacterized protein YcbX